MTALCRSRTSPRSTLPLGQSVVSHPTAPPRLGRIAGVTTLAAMMLSGSIARAAGEFRDAARPFLGLRTLEYAAEFEIQVVDATGKSGAQSVQGKFRAQRDGALVHLETSLSGDSIGLAEAVEVTYDGSSTWVWFKESNMVTVSSAEPDLGRLSPLPDPLRLAATALCAVDDVECVAHQPLWVHLIDDRNWLALERLVTVDDHQRELELNASKRHSYSVASSRSPIATITLEENQYGSLMREVTWRGPLGAPVGILRFEGSLALGGAEGAARLLPRTLHFEIAGEEGYAPQVRGRVELTLVRETVPHEAFRFTPPPGARIWDEDSQMFLN